MRNKGFTFVELFLVTAILTVVLATIFSTFAGGVRIWNASQNLRASRDHRFIISMERIRTELKGFIRDCKEITFQGDKDKVSFPAVINARIVEITYRFDKKHDALIKETVQMSDSLKEKMSPAKQELFSARGVNFSYLIFNNKINSGGWVSTFSSADEGVPRAIKMNINRNNKIISEFIFIPQ